MDWSDTAKRLRERFYYKIEEKPSVLISDKNNYFCKRG